MRTTNYLTILRWALVIIGVIFIFGLFPLMQLWPSGWRWQPPQYEYEQMIMGIYATLGVFLIIAGAKNPLKHWGIIWFTVWSSVVHGGIMAAQAIVDRQEWGHFFGDIPALFIIAIVLGVLMTRCSKKEGLEPQS